MNAGRGSFLAFALLLWARIALPQTTGSIEGRVLDAEGRPLPGVTVTTRSPSLQGVRATSTDIDGRFILPGLPPGDYSVRAERAGLPAVEQVGLKVAIDRGLSVELRALASFRETVEVLGAPPLLDVTSAATGTILEPELIRELPTARTFLSLAYLAPGVVDTALTGNPSINGASLAENRYLVEGLDVTDPRNGTLESTLPVDFLQQVEIKTGGYGPEYGSATGGIVNVVTKSGSNELHGTVFGYYRDDGMKSDPPASVQNVSLLSTKEYEAGATLGGRVIRDRLWYFLGIDPTFRDQEWMTKQAFRVTDESDTVYYTVKLTGQIHPSHQLVASAFGDPTEGSAHSLGAAGILRNDSQRDMNHFVLAYHGVPSSRLWLEVRAGRYEENDVIEPATDQEYYLDISGRGFAAAENCGDPGLVQDGAEFAPGCLGGTWDQPREDGTRKEARAAATAQAKTGRLDHELKAGANWRRSSFDVDAHWPGAVDGPFRDRHGNVLNPRGVSGHIWLLFPDSVQLNDLDLDTHSRSEEVGLFLQDRVRVSERVTLDLGIRADRLESTGPRSDTDRNLRIEFGFEDMIAPRLGVAWDALGRGRSRLFAHYGRSYDSVPLALNAFAFSFDNSYVYNFEYPADGNLPSVTNLGEIIPCTETRTFLCGFRPTGGRPEFVEPGLKAMYNDSYTLGFEYQIGSDVSVGLTGVYSELGNAIDDVCVASPRVGGCYITNPGGTIRVHPITGVILETPVTFTEPVREYRALQLAFQKRLRGNWQLSGNYVYSSLEGNYGGAIHERVQFLWPHLTEAFDSPQPNTLGSLPNERTHQAKLYGSYQWGFGLTSGLIAQFFTGTPVSKVDGAGRFITARGSGGRTPDIYNIDLHLAYSIPVGKVLSLSLFGDVFNVTDAQRAIAVVQTWTRDGNAAEPVDPNACGGPGTGPGTACPLGNPNWGGPLRFQEPRTVRLGARLSW